MVPASRFVTGLDKENFQVFEGKDRQEVRHFSSEDAPISLGVIRNLVRKLNDALGSTSIVVTHDVQEALDIVDYVYYLSEGVMVAHGTPEQMRASKDPLVHQFVWGEADGPVAFQYPSRKFSEELELV